MNYARLLVRNKIISLWRLGQLPVKFSCIEERKEGAIREQLF